jgi:hypothetical protein
VVWFFTFQRRPLTVKRSESPCRNSRGCECSECMCENRKNRGRCARVVPAHEECDYSFTMDAATLLTHDKADIYTYTEGRGGFYEHGYQQGWHDSNIGHTSDDPIDYIPAATPSGSEGYKDGYDDAKKTGAPGFTFAWDKA